MSNSKNQDKTVLERIEKSIHTLEDDKFSLYFFVMDTKGQPNSQLSYIYQLAKTLYDKKYNVTMLYQLENPYSKEELDSLLKNNENVDYNRVFVGVSDWMGKDYADIPHLNISTDKWVVSPSDFLFIPEVFSSLMFETYKQNIPCKRYVLLQNYDNVTDFIPLGVQWLNYGISDVITTTEFQKNLIQEVFPYTKVDVLPPYIENIFCKPEKPQKLIVNILCKDQKIINKIIKNFYWKYPSYQFVSFRDLRGFSREKFAELLKEGAITIWIDENTYFGYSALEAMRCNNVVIGKIPENETEWMVEGDSLKNNVIWFDNYKQLPFILSAVIKAWMTDKLSQELIQNMEETNAKYLKSDWDINVENLITDIKNKRLVEFNGFHKAIENKLAKKEEQ